MDIVIIGASDIFDLVEMVHGPSGWRVIGYCGLVPITTSRYAAYPYLGPDVTKIRAAHPQARFVAALSSNLARRRLFAEIRHAGGQILDVIFSKATIFPSAWLGPGVIVQPGVIVSAAARVAEGTYLNCGAFVAHDVRVGSFSFIAPGARLLGEAEIGDEEMIGANAVVFPQIKIGDGAKIGAGAVIRDHVPSGMTVICERKNRFTPSKAAP